MKGLVGAHWTEHLVQVYREENDITKEFLKEIGFQKSNDKKYERTYKQIAFIKEKRKEFTDCYSVMLIYSRAVKVLCFHGSAGQ